MFGLGFSITDMPQRRAGGGTFAPSVLSGLAAWYDPSDLSTLFQDSAMTVPVTSDGDPVGAMLDKSGNGNHLLQSINDSRPTYRISADVSWINGDGIDDFMTAPPAASGYDFTMIAGAGSIGPSRGIVTLHNSSSRYWSLHTGTVSAQTTYRALDRQGAGATYSISQDGPTDLSVVVGEWTAGQVSLSVDDAAAAPTATSGSADDPTSLRLLSFRDGSHTAGNIYSALVYDRTLTASERTDVASWIAAKQGRSL